jgi:polyphosphate kinase 2 PPK2
MVNSRLSVRHELANDRRRDRLTPRGLGQLGLKLRDEGRGAVKVAI